MWGTQRKKRRAKKRNRTDVDFNAIVREEGEDQGEISLQGAADAFLRKSSRTRYNIMYIDFDLFRENQESGPKNACKVNS
jgi:hypothetical protein